MCLSRSTACAPGKKENQKNTKKANMGHCRPFILKFEISFKNPPTCRPVGRCTENQNTTTRKNKPDMHGKEG